MALIELDGDELEFSNNPPIHPICLPSEGTEDRDKWRNRLIDIGKPSIFLLHKK